MRIKLITFNMAHGRGLGLHQGLRRNRKILDNLDKIATLLRDSGADVIALQEVDTNAIWTGKHNQVEYLQNALGYPYSVAGTNNLGPRSIPLQYGNALISRFPILFDQNIRFADRDRRLGGKGCLYVELDAGGRKIPILNLHLDHKSRRERLVQIEKIIHFVQHRRSETSVDHFCSPVLCGDFNSRNVPLDATHKLHTWLNESVDFENYILLPSKERTFPSHWPQRTIDFIFLPEQFRSPNCRVLRGYWSDHLPVLAEFEPVNTHATSSSLLA
jgi:endonuclease/exonuclease/phosphatase family metal-dependent hydrolase